MNDVSSCEKEKIVFAFEEKLKVKQTARKNESGQQTEAIYSEVVSCEKLIAIHRVVGCCKSFGTHI